MRSTLPLFVAIDNERLKELVALVEGTHEERCGFLLGHDDGTRVVTTIIPATNVAGANKHIRYEIDPLEYLRAEQFAASRDQELLGIYHSHPNTAAIPSETDRQEAQPHFSYVILSLQNNRFDSIRSWRLNHSNQFDEETVIQ